MFYVQNTNIPEKHLNLFDILTLVYEILVIY